MGTNRASSTLAIPPHKYGTTKSAFWKGTGELDRFPPVYQEAEDVFEEYLTNGSMSPSRHQTALKNSSGLMELHYDTMRKRARERAVHPVQKSVPTMDRAYTACAGYSGLIPGKISGNIVGCSWQDGSRLSHETRGAFFDAPMSGMTYTFPSKRSNSLPTLQRSQSMSSTFSGSGGGSPTRASPSRGGRAPKLLDDSMFN
mmetsp:Transcript_30823/g.55957  ORF Transcript_30823/g.55957 Transcript_30823/m.55957 type:complete len:200 (+) Transcript_30823:47-646(+)|eukprot:CAMPEP_0197640910 /NCGR_PEP_ID=MMETSP1338-20131121/15031_1 /TAXON_ID=43686 ORGANISM="Pelagodinium beii, Strain RCC1491" /NCGR_SAMPLE_ID=MMETSP1338 /ASSEMBLY_ACC=CAM_ASM_000754 /LENGTH=199 /DNA_ID=CAMNT_0043213795 /DNA_START=47 /DNA_END=646 /DNA_ORIENTATION=-